MKVALVLALSLLLGSPAFAGAADDAALVAFQQAIRAKYDLKEKAFAAHDPDTIIERFYSADVISMGEGGSIVRGRKALRKEYVEVTQTHPNRVKVESFATRVQGDLGWDWADFDVTPEDTTVAPFTFKILFLWERRNGEWVCTGDMFVVDKPAAATPS
jgi:ketosteroid isomerase-like protein